MPTHLNHNTLIQSFANIELLAKQIVEGFITGLHKSPFHGFSVEFAEHRLYNNGDSVKNIDWKLFAKTEKLFIKQFEEETNLRCQLVLDVSASMYYPEQTLNKLLFSVYSAASLIYLLKKQRDAFGLTCFSDEVELATPAKSTLAHQKYLFAELEKYIIRKGVQTSTNISTALHQIAEQIHKRSLVIIFSDMLEINAAEPNLDNLFSALQHLKYNKHEVIIFNVLDKNKELNFEFDNRPYHFIDIETGEEVKLHTSSFKETFVAQATKDHETLIHKCAQYQIDFVDADINQGFSQILNAFLIKRAKMK